MILRFANDMNFKLSLILMIMIFHHKKKKTCFFKSQMSATNMLALSTNLLYRFSTIIQRKCLLGCHPCFFHTTELQTKDFGCDGPAMVWHSLLSRHCENGNICYQNANSYMSLKTQHLHILDIGSYHDLEPNYSYDAFIKA